MLEYLFLDGQMTPARSANTGQANTEGWQEKRGSEVTLLTI